MNIVVLSKTQESGQRLASVLNEMADCVRIACDISCANSVVQQINACCVFFDRDFATDYDSFFSQFHSKSIYFVPVSKRNDNLDIIAALNTQRTVFYLKEPVNERMLREATGNLRSRRQKDRIGGAHLLAP